MIHEIFFIPTFQGEYFLLKSLSSFWAVLKYMEMKEKKISSLLNFSTFFLISLWEKSGELWYFQSVLKDIYKYSQRRCGEIIRAQSTWKQSKSIEVIEDRSRKWKFYKKILNRREILSFISFSSCLIWSWNWMRTIVNPWSWKEISPRSRLQFSRLM